MAFEAPSTGATVICTNPRFEDAAGFPDPDFVSVSIDINYNGIAGANGGAGDKLTYPRGSTMSVKNAACRAKVNEIKQAEGREPGSPNLTAVNIEISGMPT